MSFETGMAQLGGHAIYLAPTGTQIGRGEPLKDTARVLSEYADIIIPIKTSYESNGSFINLTGTYQEFNNELSHPNNYYSNEKLLSYLIEINGKKVPSFDQFLKELKPFIFDCISNQNFINELPLSITDADNSNSLKRFNMYNVDSILRRSKPLQLTKEVLSDN